MHSKEFFNWLEKNNLMGYVKENFQYFKKVFQDCLNAEKEEVLIVGDRGYSEKNIAALSSACYYLAAKELGLKTNLIVQEPKKRGEKTDKIVVNALSQLRENSMILFNLSNKLGDIGKFGKSYRKFAKKYNHRFVSLTSAGFLPNEFFQDIIRAIDIDYKELQLRGAKIKNKLDISNEIHVTTKLGTDLHIDIKGMKAVSNDGNYSLPGSGGNMPCGEVYIPPRGKFGVEGRVVIDGSTRHGDGTSLIKENDLITLEIEKGGITEIKGGESAKLLQETIDWAHTKAKYPWGLKKIGEFGIGINPNARIIGSTIIDEKSLGTAHIAIGSNAWFGGKIYAIIHLDQIFRNPIIKIDGELLEIE